jgi:uncharacterized protein YuzE
MERVNLKIGSITFDHADYDDENDILYLYIGEPGGEAEGEMTLEGDHLRFVPGTMEVNGLTILGPRLRLERDGKLTVTIPQSVDKDAGDLAEAFAAVEPV